MPSCLTEQLIVAMSGNGGSASPPSKQELHETFLSALDPYVEQNSPVDEVPLEVDLVSPLPPKVRVYMYNVTSPPGGRPTDEHKSQLIVPGQKRGESASFDQSEGRIVLLVGYSTEFEVFVLWDAGLYVDFGYSRNVQVKGETIYQAVAGELGRQTRHLHSGTEEVVTSNASNLKEAILLDRKSVV